MLRSLLNALAMNLCLNFLSPCALLTFTILSDLKEHGLVFSFTMKNFLRIGGTNGMFIFYKQVRAGIICGYYDIHWSFNFL